MGGKMETRDQKTNTHQGTRILCCGPFLLGVPSCWDEIPLGIRKTSNERNIRKGGRGMLEEAGVLGTRFSHPPCGRVSKNPPSSYAHGWVEVTDAKTADRRPESISLLPYLANLHGPSKKKIDTLACFCHVTKPNVIKSWHCGLAVSTLDRSPTF